MSDGAKVSQIPGGWSDVGPSLRSAFGDNEFSDFMEGLLAVAVGVDVNAPALDQQRQAIESGINQMMGTPTAITQGVFGLVPRLVKKADEVFQRVVAQGDAVADTYFKHPGDIIPEGTDIYIGGERFTGNPLELRRQTTLSEDLHNMTEMRDIEILDELWFRDRLNRGVGPDAEDSGITGTIPDILKIREGELARGKVLDMYEDFPQSTNPRKGAAAVFPQEEGLIGPSEEVLKKIEAGEHRGMIGLGGGLGPVTSMGEKDWLRTVLTHENIHMLTAGIPKGTQEQMIKTISGDPRRLLNLGRHLAESGQSELGLDILLHANKVIRGEAPLDREIVRRGITEVLAENFSHRGWRPAGLRAAFGENLSTQLQDDFNPIREAFIEQLGGGGNRGYTPPNNQFILGDVLELWQEARRELTNRLAGGIGVH